MTTRPVVSDAAERLYERLHPYHAGDGDSGWALLYTEEAAAQTLTRIQDWLRVDDLGSGRRRVMDPWRTPAWVLPWLAWFTGTRIPLGATEDQARALIADNPYLRRGTNTYIRGHVAIQLDSPTPTIYLTENPGNVYGTLNCATLEAETPNPGAVLAALQAAVPWWVVPTHIMITGGTWEDLIGTHSHWSDVISADPTWSDVIADPTA